MVEEKILKENVAVKVCRCENRGFYDLQIQQMLSYYRGLRRREKSYFAYRGYMLILTFFSTSVRRTEIINLRWSDVDFEN